MANVHRISSQEQTRRLNDSDLFLISQAQNEYGTAYKSKKITFDDIARQTEEKFRNENFKDDLSVLNEVFSEYVDSREVKFTYDSQNAKIYLKLRDDLTLDINAKDFITSGIVESVSYVKPNLIIKFKLADGSAQEISVDISDLVIVEGGYGISVDNKTVSIDRDIVATTSQVSSLSGQIGILSSDVSSVSSDLYSKYAEKDEISISRHDSAIWLSARDNVTSVDVSDFLKDRMLSDVQFDKSTSTLKFQWNNDADNKTVSVCLSSIGGNSYYAGTGLSLDIGTRTFSVNEDVALTSWVNEQGFAKSSDIHDAKLSVICDDQLLGTFSANSDTSISIEIPQPVSYDYVKSNLSNDGYAKKMTIRVWED